jgi:predicted AlkP superfamily phosphohydrolase/phosphomutase
VARTQAQLKAMRQLFVAGFDALDAGLVRTWAEAGVLPTFRALLGSSAWCTFDIPPQYSSGMIWPSINTGLLPSEHQSGFATRLTGDGYSLRPRQIADIQGKPFWNQLADRGHRIIVADVPFSRIIPESRGQQFWGWGQHDWTGEPASHPPSLLPDLQRQFGKFPLRYAMDYSLRPESLRELRDHVLAAIGQRTNLLGSLLQSPDWTFFYAAFPECHTAGHMFWHLHDPSHPAHLQGMRAQIGDALQDTYVRLDAALGELLERVNPHAARVIFFSHGMGPNYHGNHLFPELLRRFNARFGDGGTVTETASTTERIWKLTVGVLPEKLRRMVKTRLPLDIRRWVSAKRAENPSHWRTARSFAMPHLDGFSAVRVNLIGREPEGRVAPGEAYRAYVAELETEMRRWINTETGRPAVERIHRGDEVTDPLNAGAAPDLMLWWSKASPISSVRSAKLGRVSGRLTEDKSGEHRMNGLFLVQVPGQPLGRRSIETMELIDIAPTLMELAGIAPGASYRGRSRYKELLM